LYEAYISKSPNKQKQTQTQKQTRKTNENQMLKEVVVDQVRRQSCDGYYQSNLAVTATINPTLL
jgi:hypothetical protein